MKLVTYLRTLLLPADVVRLRKKKEPLGCVVLSYLKDPFRSKDDGTRARGHTNWQECRAMASAYLDLGYRVEVVDYNERAYVPPHDTKLVIDLHGNLEKWTPELTPGCRKVLHATGAHWIEANGGELRRLAALRDRKGTALKPRRSVAPSRNVEEADHVVVLGNEYTMSTFRFAGKPITRVPLSSAFEFPWPEGRDFAEAKRRFLWVGSYGMVHKGLDLVLEAFARHPDLHLTVCGRPQKEDDFYRLYQSELTTCPNITFAGWLDLHSAEFAEIARTHASVIYPSSSEGGAGSVLHSMHAGLLPIVTREASVDLGDFGVLIKQDTPEGVAEAALTIASLSDREVEERARRAYDHVRSHHTLALFQENYRAFAREIIAGC